MLTVVAGPLLAVALAVTPGPRQVVSLRDARITESSGLVASPTHPGLVWTVNDSGSTASAYGVSLATGRTVAVLRLVGTQARDWEAMTAARGADGRGLLWIGDVGDNRAVRESVVLRLVREPRAVASADVTPVSLRVRYPDGPHDVETLIWTPDGRLLLVTKELFDGVVYQVPPGAVAAAVAGRSTLTPVVAVRVAGVAQSLVTDGAALPDGRVILRDYSGAVVYAAPHAGQLESLQQVRLPAQPQGETLTVVDGGAAVLVGSEGVRQPLWRVALAANSSGPASVPPSEPAPSASAPTQSAPPQPSPSAAPTASVPAHNASAAPAGRGLLIAGVLAAMGAGAAVVVRRRRR